MKIWNTNILISTVNLKIFMSWAKKNTIFRRIIFCFCFELKRISIVKIVFVLFGTNEWKTNTHLTISIYKFDHFFLPIIVINLSILKYHRLYIGREMVLYVHLFLGVNIANFTSINSIWNVNITGYHISIGII